MRSHILTIALYFVGGCIVKNECSQFLSVASHVENNVCKKCASDVKFLNENLQKQTPWAVEMWESSAREPTGLLKDYKYQLGDFNKCLESEISKFGVQRQYCVATLFLDLMHTNEEQNIDFVIPGNGNFWAVCSPASCSEDDMALMLQDYPEFGRFFAKFNLTHRVVQVNCRTRETSLRFNFASFAMICCISGLVIGVLWATWHHVELKRMGIHECSKYIKAFSIVHNWKELKRKDDERLRFFQGLRVASSLVIILVHFIAFDFFGTISNKNKTRLIIKDTPIESLKMGVGCFVDIFFVISGFFTFIGISKNFENKNKLELALSRYFRLMPTVGFAIAIFMVTSGGVPLKNLWFIGEQEYSNCRNNWWNNALLINNYRDLESLCFAHTWSVACDFHFYLLTIALCYCLAIPSREKLGLSITGLMLVISVMIRGFVIYYMQLKPAAIYSLDDLNQLKSLQEVKYLYVPSHTRLSPYIIGIFTALIYRKYKNANFKISTIFSVLALVTCLACFYGNILYLISFENSPYNLVSSTIFGAFHRLIAGLCTGTIILVFIFGNLPLITSLLSCTPMMILGRLTYVAYIISFHFQAIEMAMGYPLMFNSAKKPIVFLGSTVTIFLLSLLVHLLVEAPFNNLFKICTRKEKGSFDKKDK